MTTLTEELPIALAAVRARGTDAALMNPIYRALAGSVPAGESGTGRDTPPEPDSDETALLVRHVTAPAMMVLAVESDGLARRARVGIHADGATVEQTDGAADADPGASRWTSVPMTDLPGLFASLLPEGSPLAEPPRLTVESPSTVLRLERTHLDQLRDLLMAGEDAESAFAKLDGLDPRLRDALTAHGDRASLSLTLHAPGRERLEQPVSIARLWNCGRLGMYRTDAPDQPVLEVVPVEAGDVLGTVIPLLEQAIRFASGLPPTPGDEDPAGATGEGARR